MAIALLRSQMLLVEVNNWSGDTRIWIKDKEIPLEKFCEITEKFFEKYQYVFKESLERINQMAIVPGFYKYTERLALPKELPT